MGVPSVSDVLSIPTRWGGVTNGANSIAAYLAQQQQARQQLQLQQAQTLSQYQTIIQASTGQRNPNIDAILAQNPYGKTLLPQGGGQQAQPPQQGGQGMMGVGSMPTIPSGGQGMGLPTSFGGGANFNPLSGIGGGQSTNGSPVMTSQSKTFAPFGDMGPKTTTSMANPQGEAAVQTAKSQAEADVNIPAQYSKDIMQSKAKENAAYATLDSLSDNLVGNIKSAMIQSGGGGFMPEMAGKIAAGPVGQALGMSDNTSAITAMNAVKRDTAIAYARNLAGGSQGVQKLMERVLDTMPDQGMTPQQAASSLAEMKMTGLALKNGIDRLKLTPDQLDGMTAEQFQSLADGEKSIMGPDQQNQVLAGIYKNMANVPARLQGDMFTGKTFEPQTNKLSKSLGMNFNPVSQASQQQNTQTNNVPKFNAKTQKLQRNTKTGEYRVVSL